MTQREIPCSSTKRINIVKMTIPPKVIHRCNAIPIKLTIAFSTELEQKIFTICMQTQKTVNSQSNLKKNGVRGIRLPDFRLYYKAIVIKTV